MQQRKVTKIMLTIRQIIKLCEDGVDITFKKTRQKSLKGEYSDQALEIIIYMDNIGSEYDLDITILHEFIHARDYTKPERYHDRSEKHIDEEALRTYNKRPYVLKFIKELYELK
ncbi:hypothetical protein HYX16_02855 [Candidatus Woesearchaeota archaeon]|nr:hypothetical protein [Candidatus Woesearchaeota archaeon]